MKKLLALLAAFGLSASAATSVVACEPSVQKAADNMVEEIYKDFKKPTTAEEAEAIMESIWVKTQDISKEIATEVIKGYDPAKDEEFEPTVEEMQLMYNYPKYQAVIAYGNIHYYCQTKLDIFNKDKLSANSSIELWKEDNLATEKTIENDDGTESTLKLTISKLNKDTAENWIKELQIEIDAISEDSSTETE